MGATLTDALYSNSVATAFPSKSLSKPSNSHFKIFPTNQIILQTRLPKFTKIMSQPSQIVPLKCSKVDELETHEGYAHAFDCHGIDQSLVDKMAYDALVWSSLHGLVVGDKSVQVSNLSFTLSAIVDWLANAKRKSSSFGCLRTDGKKKIIIIINITDWFVQVRVFIVLDWVVKFMYFACLLVCVCAVV